MSDNTSINLGSGGDAIATDELTAQNGVPVSGIKVQRMKVGYGDDSDLTDVSKMRPLPVLLEELVTLMKTQNGLLKAMSFQLSFLNNPRITLDDASLFMDKEGF
jgi:hypothetical protein